VVHSGFVYQCGSGDRRNIRGLCAGVAVCGKGSSVVGSWLDGLGGASLTRWCINVCGNINGRMVLSEDALAVGVCAWESRLW
jgi:hypothetical protein